MKLPFLVFFSFLVLLGCSKNINVTKNIPTPAEAEVNIQEDTLDFGSVNIGDAKSLFFTISNIGGADLTFSYTSPLESSFLVDNNSICNNKLKSGEECYITVTFKPNSAKKGIASSIEVKSINEDKVRVIKLIGNGINNVKPTFDNVIDNESNEINFGIVAINSINKEEITFTNSSKSTINIISINSINKEKAFNIYNNSCIKLIEPKKSCTVEIVFSPDSVKTFKDIIFLKDDVGNAYFVKKIEGVALKDSALNFNIGERYEHASATIGDKLYIFGGNANSKNKQTVLNDLWAYDSKLDIWNELLPKGKIPAARYGHSLVNINDKLYLFGGFVENLWPTNDIYEYDPIKNSWSEIIPINNIDKVLFSHSAVVMEDKGAKKMYIFGGDNGGNLSDELWSFNPINKTWSKLSSIPFGIGRQGHTAAVIDNKMYIHGGYGNKGIISDISVYSPFSEAWTTIIIDNKNLKRYKHSSIALNDKILILGGLAIDNNNAKVENSIYLFDPKRNDVKYLGEMPRKVFSYSLSVINDIVYQFAGKTSLTLDDSSNLNILRTFDIKTNTWSKKQANIPLINQDSTMTEIQDHVYIYGNIETNLSNFMLYEEPRKDLDSVTYLSSAPTQNRIENIITKVGKKFYIFGGAMKEADGEYYNNTWVFDPDINSLQNIKTNDNAIKPTARRGALTFVDNETIYIIGGKNMNDEPLIDIWKFDTLTNVWEEVEQQDSIKSDNVSIFKNSLAPHM